MTPHGPDVESYAHHVKNTCEMPSKFDGGLAFMFEMSAMCMVSKYALECQHRELDYARCWDDFPLGLSNNTRMSIIRERDRKHLV